MSAVSRIAASLCEPPPEARSSSYRSRRRRIGQPAEQQFRRHVFQQRARLLVVAEFRHPPQLFLIALSSNVDFLQSALEQGRQQSRVVPIF
jgi:hypothetical protein